MDEKDLYSQKLLAGARLNQVDKLLKKWRSKSEDEKLGEEKEELDEDGFGWKNGE